MRHFLLTAVCAVGALLGVATPAFSQVDESRRVGVRLVADGLIAPLTVVPAPDGSGRRFVVDQAGAIRVLNADGTLRTQPFLDLSGKIVSLMPDYDERGLLGLAFHPQYGTNGRFFVYYSAPLRAGAPAGYDHTARIAEFSVSATDPNRADPASERLVLEVDKPQFNHNGGTVAFGPDGYLYISIGDGGGADDVGLGHVDDWYTTNEGGNGQDIQHNLLGNILRIDIDHGVPYAIPADNPFTAKPGCSDGCDEIWAYGLRNPYRMSFDMGGSHELFVADAGQHLWEEVSIAVKGGNFGWNIKEGAHCFSTANPEETPAACPGVVGAGHPRAGDPLIDPVIEYPSEHNPAGGGLGHVTVGGHMYRGRDLPQFSGRFIFGDWSRHEEEPDGSLFVATPRKHDLWKMQQLDVAKGPEGRLGHYVLGFGQDLAGEMYVLTTDEPGPTGTTGQVYRLVRPGG